MARAIVSRRASRSRETGARSEAPAAPGVAPPAGTRARTLVVDGSEYLVLSFPLPEWKFPEGLSASECDVARALLRGDSTEEIARERRTSPRTVANQIATLFGKLGVRSRLELARCLRAEKVGTAAKR
jgi:DNA-binding NarL/FixJ family response regulator